MGRLVRVQGREAAQAGLAAAVGLGRRRPAMVKVRLANLTPTSRKFSRPEAMAAHRCSARSSADAAAGVELSATQQVDVAGTLSANGSPGGVIGTVSSGSGSGGAILISDAEGVNVSSAHLSASGAAGTPSMLGSGGGGGGRGAIAIVRRRFRLQSSEFQRRYLSCRWDVSTAVLRAATSLAAAALGSAGVFTVVPSNAFISNSQSFSGPARGGAGAGSLTPTILVQLGTLNISSAGTLTQGCDQLIVPGSSVLVSGFYAGLGGFAQTVGTLSGSGTIDLSNGGA